MKRPIDLDALWSIYDQWQRQGGPEAQESIYTSYVDRLAQLDQRHTTQAVLAPNFSGDRARTAA